MSGMMAAAGPADCSDARGRPQLLGNCRLFASLPADALNALALCVTERQAACGETIFLQGDRGATMFVVLAGQVRIIVAGADGREHVLRTAGARESFGECALLDGQPRTTDAIAATRCRLLALERRHLLALLQSQPGLAIGLMTFLCERLRATTAQLEGLLFHSLSKRLATALLEQRAARKSAAIDMTQTELAKLIGATRESVNKKLRAWQAAGFLSLQPGRIILLSPEGLRRE